MYFEYFVDLKMGWEKYNFLQDFQNCPSEYFYFVWTHPPFPFWEDYKLYLMICYDGVPQLI